MNESEKTTFPAGKINSAQTGIGFVNIHMVYDDRGPSHSPSQARPGQASKPSNVRPTKISMISSTL